MTRLHTDSATVFRVYFLSETLGSNVLHVIFQHKKVHEYLEQKHGGERTSHGNCHQNEALIILNVLPHQTFHESDSFIFFVLNEA